MLLVRKIVYMISNRFFSEITTFFSEIYNF